MKTVLLLTLFLSTLWADFYLVNGNERIKMKEIGSGKIDFSTLASIPAAERSNESVTALAVQEDINHKHLNFRTATISLKQSNISLKEYTSVGANAQEAIITFGNNV